MVSSLPQVLFGALQVGLGLVAQGRELALVEDGEHLARLRHAALVHQDRLNPAADLEGEVGLDRLDRAGVVKLGAATAVLPPEYKCRNPYQQGQKPNQDQPFATHRPPLRVVTALNQICRRDSSTSLLTPILILAFAKLLHCHHKTMDSNYVNNATTFPSFPDSVLIIFVPNKYLSGSGRTVRWGDGLGFYHPNSYPEG